MYHLMYISIGIARVRCELMYSLLSFQRAASEWSKTNIQIVIYTDTIFSLPSNLDDIRINFRLLSPEFIDNCVKNANGNLLIVKPLLLKDLLNENCTRVILVDTDTYFIQDIRCFFEKLNTGIFFLHLKEQNLSKRDLLFTFLRKKTFKDTKELNLFSISDETDMWNSGVVGMTSSDSHLLSEICFLVEQLSMDNQYPKFEWHTIEQLSFSYYFQKQGRILAAEEAVIHYWFFKSYRYVLGYFFDYFYNNDENEFLEILSKNGLEKEDINITTIGLPSLMVFLMKKYLGIPKALLEYIPSDTLIGGLMRTELEKNELAK